MIKKLFLILALLTIIGSSIVNAQTNKTVNFFDRSHLVFTVEEEFRLKDQGSVHGLFYEHTDVQAKYLVNKYVDVFTDYRLIFKNKAGTWGDQSMFLEGFNLKYPESTNWGKLNLRTRIEIGLNKDGVDTTYELNVFPKYNTPWKFTKFDINPFAANEMFFDTLNSADFIRNRIYAGVDWKITKSIKGSTYYYHEEAKSGVTWTPSEVVVVQIKFEF